MHMFTNLCHILINLDVQTVIVNHIYPYACIFINLHTFNLSLLVRRLLVKVIYSIFCKEWSSNYKPAFVCIP